MRSTWRLHDQSIPAAAAARWRRRGRLARGAHGRKPVFNALKNLIALTEDRGPAFAPGPLDYTITGGNSSLHHMLLQKRNGDFLLALWQDSLAFDTSTKRDLAVADLPIQLSLN